MSTIKSSSADLTLNADGSGNDIILQSNASQIGSLTAEGVLTATSFAGSGASLTALNATNLGSGTVPTARLGSGTANSSVHLRGDGTWAAAGGGKLLQMVYTQSISSSAIATTSGSFVASGIQLSITPEETGSDIILEFSSSHVDVRGGNSTRLVARMYVDGSAWTGTNDGQMATVGHDTNSSETHTTLYFSQRTTGTDGTAIAFEPYFYSNTGASTTLVSNNCSYMFKIWEIGA
jgi:hypothetical protein